MYRTRWALTPPTGDPLVCCSVCPSSFTLHAAAVGALWALSLEDLCFPSGLWAWGSVTANAPLGGHQALSLEWRQLCQTWSGIRGGEARKGWLGESSSPGEWVAGLLPTLHREKRLPLSLVFLFPVGLPVAATDPPVLGSQ